MYEHHCSGIDCHMCSAEPEHMMQQFLSGDFLIPDDVPPQPAVDDAPEEQPDTSTLLELQPLPGPSTSCIFPNPNYVGFSFPQPQLAAGPTMFIAPSAPPMTPQETTRLQRSRYMPSTSVAGVVGSVDDVFHVGDYDSDAQPPPPKRPSSISTTSSMSTTTSPTNSVVSIVDESPTIHERKSVICHVASADEEKRRQKNTEAARRCREKIKQRTVRLEKELSDLRAENDRKNVRRLELIQQIGIALETLKMSASAAPPDQRAQIIGQANLIIQRYLRQVQTQRAQIDMLSSTQQL